MTKPILIGFSGKKQSGKGSACQFLTENAHRLFPWHDSYCQNTLAYCREAPKVATFPMAGPLKRLCVEVLGLHPEQVYGTDKQKNSLTRYRWENLPHYHRIQVAATQRAKEEIYQKERDGDFTYQGEVIVSGDRYTPTGYMTGRQILQEVGTGIFRHMHARIWPEACVREILASGVDVALIDDIRFPDEVEEVQKAGGVVLRFTRDIYADADQHESEKSLDRDRFDWGKFNGIIYNESLNVDEQNRRVLDMLESRGVIKVPRPTKKTA